MSRAAKLILVGIGVWYAVGVGMAEHRFRQSDIQSAHNQWGHAFISVIEATAYYHASYYSAHVISTVFAIADFLPPQVVIHYLRRAASIDPNSPAVNWYLAMQHLRMGDYRRALPYLKRLERHGPKWRQTINARQVFEAVKTKVIQRQGANQ